MVRRSSPTPSRTSGDIWGQVRVVGRPGVELARVAFEGVEAGGDDEEARPERREPIGRSP